MLRQAIENATEHLYRSYELTGGVAHDGEKGAFREFFVAQLIRPLLPHQFAVGSGVVVAADGAQSRQTDVLIFDRRLLPPILLAGDRGLFPIDSVLAAIEVKSEIRACHYPQLADAARRLAPRDTRSPSGMMIATPGTLANNETIYPLCAAFAYKSDANRDEFERLDEQNPGGSEFLRMICVLDKGLWIHGQEAQLSQDRHINAVQFIVNLLNKLEDVANSRGAYRLSDWL